MQYSLTWAAEGPEDAAERLSRMFHDVAIETDDRGRFGVSAVEGGDAAVALAATAWRGDGRGRAEVDGFLVVGDVHVGTVTISAAGRRVEATGPVLLPSGEVEVAWSEGHSARAVRFERAAVDGYARDVLGFLAGPVTFSATGPADDRRVQLWRSVERHAREDIAAHPELLHNDLIWDATARHLVATLLAVFPNSTLGWTRPDGDGGALPSTVRRAVAYMEDHLAEPVRIADIADAARLSPRGLQDAFRRQLGRTPMQQLRLLRLEAARDDLLRADPADGATVADIARRWGFEHAPRFAAAYREQFGENPRDTLRR
jgi:AraC-like DNA-binding protein